MLLNTLEKIFQTVCTENTLKNFDSKIFENSLISTMKSKCKDLDNDRYWASALYNDRFLKFAQVFGFN